MRIIQGLLHLLSRVPIFGQLGVTAWKDHAEAVRELFISMIVSTAPIWGGSIVIYANSNAVGQTYAQSLFGIISNGELFIYAASTVAPVIYIVTRDRQGVHGFPGKYCFMIFAIFCAVISSIVFTMQRLAAKALPGAMINISEWLFAAAVVVVYFALVYNNTLLPDPAAAMREEELDYVQRLRKRRP